MASQNKLSCGIIGAGIAGLSAALALRRSGHEVEIFEKSSFKHEIGAAITMTPNANLVLDRWGFESAKAGETDKCQARRLNCTTLECESVVHLSHVNDKFGHNFNAFHRVDMHSKLMDLVTSCHQPGPIPRLQLAKEAVEVDCEAGLLKFADGTEVRKDMIVIADGFKSRFVKAISGVDVPNDTTGKSVYRTLIPIDRLMAHPLVRPIFENEPSGFMNSVNAETGVMFISYPCRNDEVMNLAVFHDTRGDQKEHYDWNSPACVQDVLDQLNREPPFNPAFSAFVEQADDMKCYTVGLRDPLPRMNCGRAILIGDAAHPMQPTHAQGGCMAIEDAAALETFFSPANFSAPTDSIAKRLELWNEFRMPRDCTTQLLSNAMFYARAVEPFIKKIRTYYSGPIPQTKTVPWDKPIQDFFYGYNVFVEAEKAMKYKDTPGGIPEGAIKHFGLPASDSTENHRG